MVDPKSQSNSNTSSNRGRRGGRGWRFRGRGRGGQGNNRFAKNEQLAQAANADIPIDPIVGRDTQAKKTRKDEIEDNRSAVSSKRSNDPFSRGKGRGSRRNHRGGKKLDASAVSQPTPDHEDNPLSVLFLSITDNDLPNKDTTSTPAGTDSIPKQAPKKNTTVIKPRATYEEPVISFFQRLPGEIRWKIYQLVFGTYRVEILRLRYKKDTKKPSHTFRYHLSHRQLRPRNPKTQGTPPPVGRKTKLPVIPFGLVFSCKSIYRDTILLLYSRTQFVFYSTRAVTRFMKTTTKDAQAVIEHVEMTQVMHHEPRLTEFRLFKARSDMAWYLACEEMALFFSSLRVLHMDQTIWDWPIRLEIGELWSLPLLFFQGLEYVNVQLHMSMFKEEKLKQVAKLLEQRMMRAEAYQMREDERLARELMGPVKAKVLKLVF